MKKSTTLLLAAFLGIVTSNAQTYQWAKSMGGPLAETGLSVAVDGSGNVYTTGYFQGIVDFDPGLGTSNLTSVGTDVFISKVDAAGNFVWAKSMSGNSNEWGKAVAVDGSGNVYLTGDFAGTVDFDPGAGISNLPSAGSGDIFIAKLDTDGNFLWVKNIGGFAEDSGISLAVDNSGSVYTIGYFVGNVDFNPNAGTNTLMSEGTTDIFISKLDTDGNFVWAKSFGGVSGDYGYSIALDDANNVYTTGYFTQTADFDPGAGTNNLTSAGLSDIFVLKLDENGNFVWAKNIGGPDNESSYSIAVDGSGNVYTAGSFGGTFDFDPGVGISNLSSAGSWDIFILKLDPSGNFVLAKRIGGSSLDECNSIAVDESGNVFATGRFAETSDFDPGVGTTNLISEGSTDIFILKLDPSCNFLWAKAMGAASDDVGYSIAVDGTGNVCTTGLFHEVVDFDPGAGISNLSSAGWQDIFVHKMSECGISDLTTSISQLTISANNTGASYQWLDCDNNYSEITGETGQSFTATTNGNFAVELTVNGCVDTSACVAITSVGILDISFGNSLTIYPNPTSGEMSINLGKSYDDVTLVLRNQLGQEVLKNSFNGSKDIVLHLPGEAGLYFIEVNSNDEKAIIKVVKE